MSETPPRNLRWHYILFGTAAFLFIVVAPFVLGAINPNHNHFMLIPIVSFALAGHSGFISEIDAFQKCRRKAMRNHVILLILFANIALIAQHFAGNYSTTFKSNLLVTGAIASLGYGIPLLVEKAKSLYYPEEPQNYQERYSSTQSKAEKLN